MIIGINFMLRPLLTIRQDSQTGNGMIGILFMQAYVIAKHAQLEISLVRSLDLGMNQHQYFVATGLP